jgi:putative transferase (TIGR04331 family)
MTKRHELKIKFFPKDYDWDVQGLWKKKFPDIQIESQMNFNEIMEHAHYLVIDHPGTTFLESLAYNIPTFAFWNSNLFKIRKDAGPYMSSLKKVHILYDHGVDVAKKINENSLEREEWWFSKEVQSVRENFCHRFAYKENKYYEIWKKEWLHYIVP